MGNSKEITYRFAEEVMRAARSAEKHFGERKQARVDEFAQFGLALIALLVEQGKLILPPKGGEKDGDGIRSDGNKTGAKEGPVNRSGGLW